MKFQITPGSIAGAVIVILALWIAVEIVLLAYRIRLGMEIAAASVPFEVKPPDARARVLVIGDSTGVGTGSSSPSDSVAGRIARDFPGGEIVNLARNGARVKDVPAQLASAGNEGYDLILLQIGGNDILRFTSLRALRDDVTDILKMSSGRARRVVFISTGNVGLAPAFFPPLSWVYTWRTRSVRALFMDVAREQGVQYVDLFRERGHDLFLEDPSRYYAPDFLHPSGEGYGVWYRELRRQTDIDIILGSARVGP